MLHSRFALFCQETLVKKLVGFAESNLQPISSYATGLLAGCMEEQDIAVNFKDANARLVSGLTHDPFTVFPAYWTHLSAPKSNLGLIHAGRARAQREQMGLVDVNGGVHTAPKQHQRMCFGCQFRK